MVGPADLAFEKSQLRPQIHRPAGRTFTAEKSRSPSGGREQAGYHRVAPKREVSAIFELACIARIDATVRRTCHRHSGTSDRLA